MNKVFIALAIVAVLAPTGLACSSLLDWNAYYNAILTCANDLYNDILGCSGNKCICNEIRSYYDCILDAVDGLCLNNYLRSSIESTLDAYSSFCEFVLYSYTVRFTFGTPANFDSFTTQQKIDVCMEALDAMGYSSTDQAEYCTDVAVQYERLTGNRRADEIRFDIEIEDYIPPAAGSLGGQSIDVEYTDTSGGTQTTSTTVEDEVEVAESKGSASATVSSFLAAIMAVFASVYVFGRN